MSKNKYDDMAAAILPLVGGKDNITFLTHCITRLRFNLKDRSLADEQALENVSGVVGVQWQGDQFQVIIGQAVGDVYAAMVKLTGVIGGPDADANPDSDQDMSEAGNGKKKHKFSINKVFDALSGSITPVLPILIGAGMIKVLILVGQLLHLLTQGGPTDNILTMVADAGFYFLPIFVGASAAKKFGANQYLGMLMGAMLLYPQLVTAMSKGAKLSVFGLPIPAASYPYSIFTAIVVVWIMSYVEKFIGKYSPDSLRSVVEPMLTILVMIPLSLCLLAPAGAIIGVYFTKAILWCYNINGCLSVAFLAAVIPFVIMTGMHSAFDPYLIQAYATKGSDPIGSVVFFINNFNQGIAALVVAMRTHDIKMKQIAYSSAIAADIGGVCEPAMYGVNLKLRKPLWAVMIGNAFAGAYIGLTHVLSFAYAGNFAAFGVVTFIGKNPMNFVNFLIGIAIGMVVTFVSALILVDKDPVKREQTATDASKQKAVQPVVTGGAEA